MNDPDSLQAAHVTSPAMAVLLRLGSPHAVWMTYVAVKKWTVMTASLCSLRCNHVDYVEEAGELLGFDCEVACSQLRSASLERCEVFGD